MAENKLELNETKWPAGWEVVHDVPGDRVRRIRVFGGWLYQVEAMTSVESGRVGKPSKMIIGWHPPVFVPDDDVPIVITHAGPPEPVDLQQLGFTNVPSGPAWAHPLLREHVSNLIAAVGSWVGCVQSLYAHGHMGTVEKCVYEAHRELDDAAAKINAGETP